MSAHVLLNLLNKLGKSDKMQDLQGILLLFHNKFGVRFYLSYIRYRNKILFSSFFLH